MTGSSLPAGKVERAAVVLLVIVFCVLSLSRNSVWQNDVSLWSDTIAKSPGRYRAFFHLGNAFLLQNDYERADASYRYILSRESEIASAPFRALLHNHIGLIQLHRGEVRESISSFRRALDAKPDYPIALFNLGLAFERTGMLDEASGAYRSTLALAPRFSEARNALGALLLRQRDLPAALEQFEQALAINPSFSEAVRNRDLVLEMLRSIRK